MANLIAHPAAPCVHVRRFEARAERDADGLLRLNWQLEADLSQLRIPPAVAPARADGLWQHTCFEAFIAAPGSPAYSELNFSPSGEWAAYAFTGYRAGQAPITLAGAPRAVWRRDAGHLDLRVDVRAGELAPGAGTGALRVALAAVIEEQSGTFSYWALRHPEGRPDFHDREGFVLALAGAGSGVETGTDRL